MSEAGRGVGLAVANATVLTIAATQSMAAAMAHTRKSDRHASVPGEERCRAREE